MGVRILEARDIKGKDAGNTSDPYVRLKCANLESQVSRMHSQTNNAVWNQSFTFNELKMNQGELETFELIFQLCDYNDFASNQIIGVYSMGLSTIYRHANHEFHKVWLRLVDPNDLNPTACTGYLRVSAFIVGPGERPPIHT